MIFSSRKVNELYQRYCRQVLKILRSPSYDLTGEECREIWDEIWKEAMRRKRELRKLKSEEERQSWILKLFAVVKRCEVEAPKRKKAFFNKITGRKKNQKTKVTDYETKRRRRDLKELW